MADNSFDLAIVDPPYGFGSAKTGFLNFRQKDTEKAWNVIPSDTYFQELCRVSKNQIIWGGNYFPILWINGCRGFIYWHKGNPVPNFSDGELAWTSFDRNARQFDYRYYGNKEGNGIAQKKFHPTQKPVKLYEWLLMNYANVGNKILDTHLGGGAICIACHNLGFEMTGIEIDPEYYQAAKTRLINHQSQGMLF